MHVSYLPSLRSLHQHVWSTQRTWILCKGLKRGRNLRTYIFVVAHMESLGLLVLLCISYTAKDPGAHHICNSLTLRGSQEFFAAYKGMPSSENYSSAPSWTGLAISEISTSVPELLLYHEAVLELTLKPPLNSQNGRPCWSVLGYVYPACKIGGASKVVTKFPRSSPKHAALEFGCFHKLVSFLWVSSYPHSESPTLWGQY